MLNIHVCCKKMELAIEEEGIAVESDGEVAVPGCCGGGCNVLNNIKFCPFCGTEIETVNDSIRP